MNDRVKRWTEALRSGEFKQGRGWLRRGDSYCCLGVACELYRQEVGGSWEQTGVRPSEGGGEEPIYTFFPPGNATDNSKILPPVVRQYYDFDPGTGGQITLTSLNDDGESFAQIARCIEDNAKKFFKEDDE